MPSFECCEEGAILPRVGSGRSTFNRQVCAEEFHEVRLLGEVDAHHIVTTRCTKGLNQRRFANSRAAFQQDRLP